MEPKVVGKRIKELMKIKNITIEELSKKLNLSKNMVKNKLEGNDEFCISEMAKIKEIFKLDLKDFDDLFFGENTKTTCNM